jgi:hypothetical protein
VTQAGRELALPVQSLEFQPQYCQKKKMLCTYTVEHYSAIKKNEIMSFVGKWMELEIIMVNEINQAPK